VHEEPFVAIDVGDFAADGSGIHECRVVDSDPIGMVVFFSVAIARGCLECLEGRGLD